MVTISKMLIFCLLFLFSMKANAQMVSASFFPEMKSVNPATLTQREYGQISASLGKDSIDKLQNLTPDQPEQEQKTTWEIEVDSQSFFYGGKAGKKRSWWNPEFQYLKNGGFRKAQYTAANVDPITTDNAIDFTHYELSMGLGRYFGISFAKQDYTFSESDSFTLNSILFENRLDKQIDGTIIKVGGILPLKNFVFSGFYEQSTQKEDVEEYRIETGQNNYKETNKTTLVGLGAGFKLRNLRIETGYEKILSSDDLNGSPSRMTGTLEYRFWKVALGYTGRIYQKGFQSNEMLVYNQLVFPEQVTDTRLENIFNFAYGANGGFSVSGSFSTSKVTTQEKNPFVNANQPPYETEVESTAWSIKVGYVW